MGLFVARMVLRDHLYEGDSYFVEISEGEMVPSPMGDIACTRWQDIPAHFPDAELDEFKVMPNHIHGIIILGGEFRRDVACNVSTPQTMSSISPKAGSLATVMRSYKSAVSNECHTAGFRSFAWQPRYFDHIIRNEVDLHRIRLYIRNNVLQWALDKDDPGNIDP